MSEQVKMIGSHVRVTLGLNQSSQRTKSRLNENGSLGFIVSDIISSHKSLGGRSAVLLRSVAMSSDGSAWFGWIPINEIEIIPWEQE